MAKEILTQDSRIRRSQRVLSNAIDTETVLLDISKSSYYGLDASASRIWELLAQTVTVTQIIDILLKEYEVGKDECSRDVLAFLEELQTAGLIESINS